MQGYIINDFVDLTKTEKVTLDSGEIIERKVAITKDQFYSSQPNTPVPRPSQDSSTKSSKPNKNRYFGVLSTSDKEINYRLYDYESWKKTVTDGTWTGNPYPKPILRNHSLYFGDSVGRIKNSHFYDNGSGEIISSDGELPKEAIDYFKDKKCFDRGTGSVIVEFTPDEYTADRIEQGLDVTLSQSSMMAKLTCGVCGKSYYDSDCFHMAGRSYEVEEDGVKKVKKCLVKASDYSPVELSIVNHPANDVSIIFVMKPKGGTSDSSEIEPQIDEKPVISENSEEHEKDSKALEVSNLFKNIAKDHFKLQIGEKFNDSEEMIASFDSLFELLTDEQVEAFSDFIKKLEPKVEEATTDTSEEPEVPEVPEVKPEEKPSTDTPEVPETPKEPEIKPEEKPSTDNEEELPVSKEKNTKEDNLKGVFQSEGILKEVTIQDKEISALLKNYKF